MAKKNYLQTADNVARAHLRTLTVIGTYKCTAACRQCCFESSPEVSGQLSLPEIKQAIDQTIKLSTNLKVVVFSGGEATLLRDTLIGAIEHCRQLGLSSRLVSNGSWGKTMDSASRFAERMVAAGLGEMNLSTGPEHQEWVPLQSVENAAEASVQKGLHTVVSIEAPPAAEGEKNVYPRISTLAEKHPETMQIFYSSWMTFKGSASGEKARPSEVPQSVTGPCDQLFSNIVVTPHRAISACCGLTFEHIPEMKVGRLRNGDGNAVRTAYEASLNDFSKIWLAVDGPAAMLRQALGPSAESLIEKCNHICEVCALLHQNDTATAELKRIYPKHVAPVMQRFGLRTFEAMLPEEAKHEAT
ncbi:MAG: radical SAM protein [bacterium]|jgi:organic radical activating enzyme